MKKLVFFAAVVAAAGLASCTAQAPKANMKSDVDSLSYMLGVTNTRGLVEDYAMRQLGLDSTQLGDFFTGIKEGFSVSAKKELAYVAGMQIGLQVGEQAVGNINRQIFGNDSTKTLSRDNFLAGFIEAAMKKSAITEMEAQEYVRTQVDAIKNKALEEQYGENRAAGEKFLAENATKEGVKTTPSGLQYKVIKEGKGETPTETSTVKVHYKGTLIDGTEFDSSYSRKDKDGKPMPTTFRVNQVIKGWTEALTMMPVGSKWELYIPQELAYGNRQSGAQIKPFSALVFEVELIGIEKDKK